MSRAVVDFVAPTSALLARIAAGIRDQDRDELVACGHPDVLAALTLSCDRSVWAAVALVDGQPACVFGCAQFGPSLCPEGVPWMLGTDLVALHGRALQRYAPRYIAAMLRVYPRLVNLVHARNHIALSWLRRLGFVVHEATAHPVTGELFHLFELKRNV